MPRVSNPVLTDAAGRDLLTGHDFSKVIHAPGVNGRGGCRGVPYVPFLRIDTRAAVS